MKNVYDLDTVVDRRGTNCLKYDFMKQRGVPEDVLPMWVADMDFRTAPEIIETLQKEVSTGIYGYNDAGKTYFPAVSSWMQKHHGWTPEEDWLVKTPGVVFALAAAVRAYTEPGEKVLIQQPVYYPFRQVIWDNGREVANSPLVSVNGHYEIDFADFAKKAADPEVKLFLLCSPHNPVGRVWTEAELRKLEEICLAYDVTVVVDEIHEDFVWGDSRHHVLVSLDPSYQKNTITCTAPSKTFNLAGLQTSNIFIPDPALRRKFQRAVDQTGYSQLNGLGLSACEAAYTHGEAWLAEVKTYIWDNILYFDQYLKDNLPMLHMEKPEGTYLLWVDFRDLGLTEAERQELLLKKAKLWLDSGAIFGKDGEGFERFNVACPRSTVTQALTQLKAALTQTS